MSATPPEVTPWGAAVETVTVPSEDAKAAAEMPACVVMVVAPVVIVWKVVAVGVVP